MDDFTKQTKELELLVAVYGKNWKTNSRGEGEHSIDVKHEKITVVIYFTIPQNYPSISPPIYEMTAPQLTKKEKSLIHNALKNIYANNAGDPVLYQYVEKVREMLDIFAPIPIHPEKRLSLKKRMITNKSANDIEIVHSGFIEDRRSIFQGHAAIINSKTELENVLRHLKKMKGITEATHNILAWKFGRIKDYDDDGLKAAGSRLLHLFDLLGVDNVIVIVSRWHGGSLIGPARFKHINNVARMAIIEAVLKK